MKGNPNSKRLPYWSIVNDVIRGIKYPARSFLTCAEFSDLHAIWKELYTQNFSCREIDKNTSCTVPTAQEHCNKSCCTVPSVQEVFEKSTCTVPSVQEVFEKSTCTVGTVQKFFQCRGLASVQTFVLTSHSTKQ